MSEKALQLVIGYASETKRIKELGELIGREFLRCSRSEEPYTQSHLKDWYETRIDIAREEGFVHGRRIDEIKGMPTIEALKTACPHCAQAQLFIDERKSHKRKLGTIKASINRLGKSLTTPETTL